MLIPRFSIKWLLLATAGCAGVSLLVSGALAGKVWALAIVLGLACLVVTVVFHAAAFLVAWVLAQLYRLQQPPEAPQNPFAGSQPPPQLVSPSEPH